MRLTSYHPAKLAAVGALVATLGFMPTAAQAWDQRIEDGVHHYIECFKFMVTDEASHIAFCSPSRGGEWFIPESEYSGSPPPPPPKENCEPHQARYKTIHKDFHKTIHKDTRKTSHKIVQKKPHKAVQKPHKKGLPNVFQMGNFHVQVPSFARR